MRGSFFIRYMDYIQLSFSVNDEAIREVLIAKLSEAGYEGFEETDNLLNAFISSEAYDEAELHHCLAGFDFPYTKSTVQQQNWNALWEKSFEPVIVEGFCTVRADFHAIDLETPYEVVITPKMSFGTGHHATTMLMMQEMQHINMTDKKVLDFGAGTGILAILAENLGARDILAIDNDEWCFENITENIARNNSVKVRAAIGSLEIVEEKDFDIILANINRHILLMYMDRLYELLDKEGVILMSGLLKEDYDIISTAATKSGFKLQKLNELNNWIVLLFHK